MAATPPPSEQSERDQLSNEIIQSLPKKEGWWFTIYQHKGFWLSSISIKGQMFIEHSFKSQPDDIIVASSMKCGTTWLKSLVFATINRDSFDISTHPLLTSNPHNFFIILDMFQDEKFEFGPTNLDTMPSPRHLATHLPYTMFPDSVTGSGCRFVYICRDPKDALVSKWHFAQKLRSKEMPPLSIQEAFDKFCEGVSHFGPFWDHVLSYWKASLEQPDEVLFLKYEDMKRDPVFQVKRLAEFLGKPFSMQEQSGDLVEEIIKLCSFKNLSNLEINQSTSFNSLIHNSDFFRKGDVGDWKNYLTPEMAEKLNQITNEMLHGSGLTFASASL